MKRRFRLSVLNLILLIVATIFLVVNFAFKLDFPIYVNYGLIFVIAITLSLQINRFINIEKFKQLRWLENRMGLWENISYRVNLAGEEAFNEMPLGIILFDANNSIEWSNKYARQIFMSPLVNKNLSLINPNLLAKIEAREENFDLYLYGRTFNCDIRYEQRIIYLLDKTEEIAISKKLQDKTLAIGVLNIDNINDALASFDAQERAVHISNIIGILTDWAEENEVLLRGYSEERYLIITDLAHLVKLQENQFDVIDELKVYSSKEELRISLSIGMACKGEDVITLFDLAEEQLNHALSRGGDQAVVLVNEDLFYYGARSESIETRSTVSIRVKAEEISELIKASSNVIVMSHAHMDADAFASGIALVKIARSLGREAQFVFNSDSVDQTVALIFESIKRKHRNILDLLIQPNDALSKLKNETLLIIVDVQNENILFEPKLYNRAKHIAIIDHHRRGPESIQKYDFLYSQTSSSSSVELVTELIEFLDVKVEISNIVATWMLLGIIVDTNYFAYRTNHQTYNVLAKLHEYGANSALVKQYLREDLATYAKKNEILSNLEIYDKQFCIVVGREEIYERQFLAKLADSTITINNIEAGFAIGYIDKDVIGISARSLGQVNVQLMMESIGGGGHFNNAAAQLRGISLAQAREILIEKIDILNKGEDLPMKVILKKDLKGKGKVDDIIDVPAGHANYLIRTGQAVEATPDNLKQLEQKHQKVLIEAEQHLQEMKELKATIETKHVTIEVRVGKEGKLFGSVSTKQIIDALKKEHDIDVDRRKVTIDEAIESLGTYYATVQLHKEVLAKITLHIVEKV